MYQLYRLFLPIAGVRDEDRRLKVIANDLLFIILLVPESNSGFGGQQEFFFFPFDLAILFLKDLKGSA